MASTRAAAGWCWARARKVGLGGASGGQLDCCGCLAADRSATACCSACSALAATLRPWRAAAALRRPRFARRTLAGAYFGLLPLAGFFLGLFSVGGGFWASRARRFIFPVHGISRRFRIGGISRRWPRDRPGSPHQGHFVIIKVKSQKPKIRAVVECLRTSNRCYAAAIAVHEGR